MATFDEFYQSLPEDSNKRGEYFEKIFIPWFLKTDPEWSSKIKQIWLWDEYPDRWGKDCGIDLVYEDQEERHWAIQSKCIAPDREISKAEIDSFLSESNDPRIYGRLLIASTDGIGKNAQQVIERQEKQVVCFLREHFRQSEVEFPASRDDLTTGRRKDKRRPRPHQREAIQNVVAGLHSQERGQLLMACGTGKTLTSLWIKEELKAKRTLVLLPSLSLLSQTLREWTATCRTEFKWICVCSDKSVAEQDKTIDGWIENRSELGVPVTSEPEEIKRFLLEQEEGIIFSTYQSSPLVAEAQESSEVPAFDIAFADEAHRCAGKVSAAFGCVLDGQKIRAVKRLFMTATPRVLSNRIKSRAENEDIEFASMDDEGQFGKVLHRLNFSEAIQRDLLTDYQVVVVCVDDPEVQAHISNRSLSTTDTGVETDYETLANHISLAKSIDDYNLKRVITFHGRVKGARKFSEDHAKVVNWLQNSSRPGKTITTDYVSGDMSSFERNNKIRRLRNLAKGEIGILSNARCLSEGVDVPTLDGIAFIDPRSSQVDIIQAVGRAIRKSDSKSFGYIILPVYLGDIEQIEEELLASKFRDVWEIILALKSQDDSLTEVLDRMRIELGKRPDAPINQEELSKIVFIPKRIENRIGESLRTILVRNTTDSWMENYGKVSEFIETNKRFPKESDSKKLATWLETQRGKYRKRLLANNRIKKLEELPSWNWSPSEGKQERWVELIHTYYQENGNLAIPDNDPTYGNIVTMLRNGYHGHSETVLDQTTIDALNKLKDKGWMWNNRLEIGLAKIELLKEWCIENNSAIPPRDTVCKGNLRTYSNRNRSSEFDLGKFVGKLRGRYRKTFYPELPARRQKQSSTENPHRGREITEQEIKLTETIPGWYWDKCEGFARVFGLCIEKGIRITRQTRIDFDLIELRGIGDWAQQMKNKQRSGTLHPFEELVLSKTKGWQDYVMATSKDYEDRKTSPDPL